MSTHPTANVTTSDRASRWVLALDLRPEYRTGWIDQDGCLTVPAGAEGPAGLYPPGTHAEDLSSLYAQRRNALQAAITSSHDALEAQLVLLKRQEEALHALNASQIAYLSDCFKEPW